MTNVLLCYLQQQNWYRVISLLSSSKKQRGLREIADLLDLSVSGTRQLLLKLCKHGILKRTVSGQRTIYSLEDISNEPLFKQIFAKDSLKTNSSRVKISGQYSIAVFNWMQRTSLEFSEIKRNVSRPA